jgi:nucleoside-diphosphate kinase
MPIERTLSIIKPDGVSKNVIGEIIKRFEANGLRIAAMKMIHATKEMCGKFYDVHKDKPFYHSLIDFMSSQPIVVMVLEGENAIQKNREIMGVTDPAKAEKGTIRRDFGTNVEKNAVHGSDSPETAKREIQFFFNESEIYRRF